MGGRERERERGGVGTKSTEGEREIDTRCCFNAQSTMPIKPGEGEGVGRDERKEKDKDRGG